MRIRVIFAFRRAGLQAAAIMPFILRNALAVEMQTSIIVRTTIQSE
jgi:hypothetical protein